jgi:CrcB protein
MDAHDQEAGAGAGVGPGAGAAGPAAEPEAAAVPEVETLGGTEPRVLAAMAAGGTLGTLARYGAGQLVTVAPGTFPWATFGINVSGSFVLGAVVALLADRFPPSHYLRAFVAIGFLGAYTTYSTFAVETDRLISGGHEAVAAAYLAATLLVGTAAAWAGLTMTRRRLGPAR